MKKTLKILFIFTLLVQCTSRKSALKKEVQNTSIESNQKSNENIEVKNEVQEKQTSSVKFKRKTDESISLIDGLSKQSISLKNSGKCADVSTTRNVLIEDKNGNKMTIPVNDNSELNINSENNFRQQNKIFKTEIDSLKSENSLLNLKYDSISKTNKSLKNTLAVENLIKQKDTEKKGVSWYWWILIGAVGMEFLRITFKIIVLNKS